MKTEKFNCADGTIKDLVVIREMGDLMLVASPHRVRVTPIAEIYDYLVGFKRADLVASVPSRQD